MNSINIVVTAVEKITEYVKKFTLQSADGSDLPAFSGGSHIVVAMDINGRVHRNPYSLLSSPLTRDSYQIAVRRQDPSRGGSVFMHDNVAVDTQLKITYPVNLFAINKLARKNILVAGGIGITPLMSQIHDLNESGSDYELHYAYRSPEHAAFRDQLEKMTKGKSQFYIGSENEKLDFTTLLTKQPLGTHVYICGPEPMVDALIATAKELGWPESSVHSEQFLAPQIGESFKVQLTISDIEIEVAGEMSLLEAIENAGVEAPYLCRGGACGRCELEVVDCDGTIMHHDHYLTDTEKASGKKIMPCVSRAKCTHMAVNI